MRKRRRNKFTWMPTLGGLTQQGDSAIGTTAFGFYLEANASSALSSVYITSLVPDQTFWPDEAQVGSSTLRDFTEGQDWFLRRIVGKVAISVNHQAPTSGETSWRNLLVGAAFFVARAKDENQDFPDLETPEYDPLVADNVRQPWIWRRTWVLQNGSVPAATNTPAAFSQWQGSNTFFGSALDGPHIDAKTLRRIRREERLWFCMSAIGFNSVFGIDGETVTNPVFSGISGILDYRILGNMRKSSNRSNF